MAFGWAGAAAGAQAATERQAQKATDLESALAERELKRQAILVQQAQAERARQQMDLEREEFGARQATAQTTAQQAEQKQAAIAAAAGMAPTPYIGKLIEAGLLNGSAALPPETKGAEPFTLGPGQMRFGADGQMVAKGAAPQASAASRDQDWVIRNGKPMPIPKGTAQAGDQPYDPVAARQTAATAAGSTSPYQTERTTRTLASVNELLPKVNHFTVGFGTDTLGNIGGTDARNFRAQLETLKSNIITSELTAMRQASKTGGALGQVSDREASFLSASLGALDPGQSPENFKEQLNKIKGSIERWQAAVQSQGGGGGKSMTRDQLRAIAQKNGVSEADAEKQAVAQGYTVQ